MAKRKKPVDKHHSGDGWVVAERLKWLLQDKWKGSRSAMAKEIKMSLSAIIHVITGQQQPGRQLLPSIVQNSDVNARWLLIGEGSPYTGTAIPVAHQVLP